MNFAPEFNNQVVHSNKVEVDPDQERSRPNFRDATFDTNNAVEGGSHIPLRVVVLEQAYNTDAIDSK